MPCERACQLRVLWRGDLPAPASRLLAEAWVGSQRVQTAALRRTLVVQGDATPTAFAATMIVPMRIQRVRLVREGGEALREVEFTPTRGLETLEIPAARPAR